MKTWLALAEVRQLTGWSDRTVRLKAQTDQLETRLSSELAGNRKPQREYALESLSAAAQMKYANGLLAKTPPPGQLLALPDTLTNPDDQRTLSDEQRDKAAKLA